VSKQPFAMTQEDIQRQLESLDRVAAELAKNPELGRQLLINIGLMKEETPRKKKRAKKRTK